MLLCLDYDGTLVPLTSHPSEAILPPGVKRLLERVHQQGIHLAVISGRALRDVKQRVRIRGLYYAGNHGLELDGPGLRYVNPIARSTRPLLTRMARELETAVHRLPGVWVEDKGLTLSLHWRQAPPSVRRRLPRLIGRALASYRQQGRVVVTSGKRVIEIRPPINWNKGDAVAWLIRHLPRTRPSPRAFLVYVGDDQTDEDAFQVVNRFGGASVCVGRPARRSAARYRMKNPREVCLWLTRLLRPGLAESRSEHESRSDPTRDAKRSDPRLTASLVRLGVVTESRWP
ncbi:MAG: trehalose-phosphatase [Candidatus Omnitrophica bacterium]|nr:trehalose-phosphatase [Candidatus Omnitrophota bacterium]